MTKKYLNKLRAYTLNLEAEVYDYFKNYATKEGYTLNYVLNNELKAAKMAHEVAGYRRVYNE